MKEGIVLLLLAVFSSTHAAHKETLTGTNYVYSFWASGSDNIQWNECDFKCNWLNYEGLAIIKYKYVDDDLSELMDAWGTRCTWIGMSDQHTEGYWHWADGSKVNDYYLDWKSGEPNNHRGEDCGCYVSTSMNWNDEGCDHDYGFICSKALNKRTALDNSEYIIGDVTSDDQYDGTLAGARLRCTDLGYRLAEVTNDKVVDQIKKNSKWNPSEKYWVGGPKRCLNSESCTGKLPYICEAFHSYGLELSSLQKDYKEYETIKIDCTASGLPLPNVTWYKNSGQVSLASGKGAYQISELGKSTLIIENAKLEDTARYRCYSANLINGESRKTKIYTDIRVHSQAANEVSLGGSVARSGNTKSLAEDEDTVPSAPECADWTTAAWMLPTIFALNIIILLAIGVLMCSRRSTPTKSAGNEFTNYAVYSTSGRDAR